MRAPGFNADDEPWDVWGDDYVDDATWEQAAMEVMQEFDEAWTLLAKYDDDPLSAELLAWDELSDEA